MSEDTTQHQNGHFREEKNDHCGQSCKHDTLEVTMHQITQTKY